MRFHGARPGIEPAVKFQVNLFPLAAVMDHWSWAISGFGVTREDNASSLVRNSLEIVNRSEDMTKADGRTFRHLCLGVRSFVPTDLNYFMMVSISIQMFVLSCRDAWFPNVINGTCASVWRFPKGLCVKGLVLRLVLWGDGGTLTGVIQREDFRSLGDVPLMGL